MAEPGTARPDGRLHPRYLRPCSRYLGELGRHCGQTPTRPFLEGPLCREHAPVAVRPAPRPATGTRNP